MRHPYLVLALFLILTVGGGSAIGIATAPGDWYAGLSKAWFNPPSWVFAPAWTLLYILIGIAGWRVWHAGELQASRVWWLQIGLNFLWSPVFFILHWTGAALLVMMALLGAIAGFIALTWRHDRPAAFLFMPYAAWVSYALLLNGAIWWLN